MFLVNSRLGLVSATLNAFGASPYTHQVPLIPKLRGYFAEFLHHDSLDRLGILYLSTCVGLGYGRLTTRSRRFSRQHRITHFRSQRLPRRHVSGSPGADLPTPDPTHLARDYHRPGWATFLRPSAACLLPDQVTDSPTQTPKGHGQARMLSITRFSTDVVSPVPEYQLVVHRLRLSASP